MTPDFQIIAAGEDVTGTLATRLIKLSVTDEDGRSGDKLSLEIDNADAVVSLPERDVKIEVSLGFKETGLVRIGQFSVDRVRGSGMPRKMSIDCTAANMNSGLRSPKSRGWTNQTLASIVDVIAGEAGLQSAVGASVGGTHYDFVAQSAESDLNLLMRLARPLDATAKPAGGRLVVQRRDEGVNAAGEPMATVALLLADLSGWSWDLDERQKYESVTAEWGDIDGGETETVTAGSGKPVRKLRHVYATKEEAQRAVEAELGMSNREHLTLSASCSGFRPELFAGGTVTVSGLEPDIDGKFLVSRVVHNLDAALTTTFEGRRAK